MRTVSVLLLSVLLVPTLASAQHQPRGNSASAAKYNACKYLTSADVSSLIGANATSELTQLGQNCTWRAEGSKEKLMVRTQEQTRTPADVAYDRYKNGPHFNYQIKEQPSLGDHAVTAITPYGIELMVLKHNEILFIQYGAGYGVKGSPEMLEKALPVFKKAADAF